MADKPQNPKIERALYPQVNEEFKVTSTIEDQEGKEFVVKFIGSVDNCNDWLRNVSRTFSVLKYDIVFVNAIIEMI